jgi:hypothetical protein
LCVLHGQCNFLKRYIRPRAQITAWQRADLAKLAVSAQECQKSIQWFAEPGSVALTGVALLPPPCEQVLPHGRFWGGQCSFLAL